jgi:hypothetical protein
VDGGDAQAGSGSAIVLRTTILKSMSSRGLQGRFARSKEITLLECRNKWADTKSTVDFSEQAGLHV